MKHDINFRIWVVKFCLKVTYPKFNSVSFLVFLAVKYRKQFKKKMVDGKSFNTFNIKTIPASIQKYIVKDLLVNNTPVLLHKSLIISRGLFMEMASENIFYLDKGLIWMSLKLSPSNKLKEKLNQESKEKYIKYDLNIRTSEVHKKLWESSKSCPYERCRVVPVVGSKHVPEKVVLATESELHNIISQFELEDLSRAEITFCPVPKPECAPNIAAAAEVSLIVNDYDLSNDFIKEVLSNHFEVPKLIHVNDIFFVDLTPDVTAKYHYKYADLIQTAEKLYFKCLKLNVNSNQEENPNFLDASKNNFETIDQPFFIVKGVTQLTLGESLHKLKPKDEYFNLQDKGTGLVQLLRNCPKGLKNKFDQMQEAIAPFLSGELKDLTTSLSSPIMPLLLLTGSIGSGRHLLVKTLAKYNGMNCLQIDCNALQSSTAKQTESKISATIQRAKATSPAIVLMDNFEVFAVDPENNEDCRLIEYFMNSLIDLYQNYTKHAIIFVAVTERSDLKPNILRLFLEKFHIPKLNAHQRLEMLQWFASAMQLRLDTVDAEKQTVDNNTLILDLDSTTLSKPTVEVLKRVAAKTETFRYGDLDTLMHFALRESYLQQHSSTKEPLFNTNIVLQEEHFDSALESMRSLQSQHLDAPKIPKVYWEDIGGLDKLKKELLKTIEFPIKYPHLFKNSSLKRSGILLYGPPGCGKTLVAKAVSTELNVSFLSVKGPELLNMYIGQSEENVRRVFETARASSPCIVFLDELDAMAARRGAAGDSGGASDRLVSQLLAELDGVTTHQDADTSSFVFVMGATNRPDLLERSLLRPGRLDKMIYVGPYCGLDEKTRVLTALCRSHKLRGEVRLRDVAAALPDRCTGADLLQVVSTARAAAVRGLVARIQTGLVKESELSVESVIIGISEMWEGVQSFRPSVTDEELAHYESLQTQM